MNDSLSLKELLALTRRLTALHRELGIPASYAVDRRLAPHLEPDQAALVLIGTHPDGRPIHLIAPAADAWRRLHAAAALDRVMLIPVSGFRSIARQAEIIRDKLARGTPLDEILRYVAAPGFSEHHSGCALDIACPEHPALEETLERTDAFRWLERRAPSFGFHLSYPRDNPHGIGYEPWHWCWSRNNSGNA